MEGMPKPSAESDDKKRKMGGLRSLFFGAGALVAAGASEPAPKSPTFEAHIPPAGDTLKTAEMGTVGIPNEAYEAAQAAAPVEPQTIEIPGTPEVVTVSGDRQTVEMPDKKPTVVEMNTKKTVVGPPEN